MTNKKNRFFTFCFSMIPGAGEMYLGFYKMGISLMGLFALLTTISGFFNISASLFLLPVIWFYSFFHVHNLNSLPDEEFYALEDRWLFPANQDGFVLNDFIQKHQKLIAVILIFFGASVIWNILTDCLSSFIDLFNLSNEIRSFLWRISHMLPQSLMAVLIIYLGIKMIGNKKNSIKHEEDSIIPSPPYIEVKKEEKEENQVR